MTLKEFASIFHVSQTIGVKSFKKGTYDFDVFRIIPGCELGGNCTHLSGMKEHQNREVEKVEDDCNGFITIWLKPLED